MTFLLLWITFYHHTERIQPHKGDSSKYVWCYRYVSQCWVLRPG